MVSCYCNKKSFSLRARGRSSPQSLLHDPFHPCYAMDVNACLYVCVFLGYGVIIAKVLLYPVKLWVEPPHTDDWHMVTTALTHFWLPLYWSLALWPDLFRRIVFWKAIFDMSSHTEHEKPACTVPLLRIYVCLCVCFSAIMDHLVNNAAEGWHCTTFSHENSFSLCRSLSLSPSSGHPYKTISFLPIDPVCQCTHNQYKVWEERNRFECKSTHCIRESCPAQWELLLTFSLFIFCATGLMEFSSLDMETDKETDSFQSSWSCCHSSHQL